MGGTAADALPRRATVGVAVILFLGLAGTTEAQVINQYRFRMMSGDSAAWSRTDFDDSRWPEVLLEKVPDGGGIRWLRARVTLGAEPERPMGVFVSALASHDLYWDGERIGRGGVVGATAAQEVPGPIQILHYVPDRLARSGEHVIALRVSAFHRHFHPTVGYWAVLIGDYARLDRAGRDYIWIAVCSFSGIVIVTAFALLTFALNRREKTFLRLGLLGIVSACLLAAEAYRPLVGYAYPWHPLRLWLITGFAWLLDLALVSFLVRQFPLSGSKWLVGLALAGSTIPILAVPVFDGKVLAGYLAVFTVSLVWTLRAVRRGLLGARLASVGLGGALAGLVFDRGQYLDRTLYVALFLLLLCLLASHALQFRAERRERDREQWKSARLEIELLKKRFQPHFLMNTLTALSEWVEEDPAVAAGMIQALGEELRLLGAFSDRKLVSMGEELALCRSHLHVMSCRSGRTVTLETVNVDPDVPIPPAVIHTLVENALTHGRAGAGDVLRLRSESGVGWIRYVFESPFEPPGELAEPPGEGTGLRYVRARLRESFGEAWSLSSAGAGTTWRTEIVVPGEAPG